MVLAACGDAAAGTDAGTAATDATQANDANRGTASGGSGGADASNDTGGSSTTAARTMLVDHLRWELLEAAGDPFDDRPATTECMPRGLVAEDLGGEIAYQIDTRFCDYATVTQTSSAAIAAGDHLRFRMFHFALNAPEPAEAHAALRIGSETVWEERFPIPSDSALVLHDWQAETAVPAETPIFFHLHNHGDNTWLFVELSTGPEAP